jgi:hypothetical protein
VISYLAALLAAVTNATSKALNRKAAREAPGRDQFRLRLISDLLHRKAWLAAISLMFLSFVFSAVALGTGRFADGGVLAVISSWQLYAAGAAGIVSFWLLENAYHAGPLAAAQPGITLADPLVATTWGVFVFSEPIRTGPVLVLVVLPAAALIAGAVALIRSPRLQALQADGTSSGGTSAGPRERREQPVEAAGRR